MRLPMAIGSGIVMVLGIAIAPGAAGQPKGPDEGRKVYRVQLKDSTRFPKWKVAAFKGTADEKGDHFLLDKLTTLQPVVISLLPGNKDDDIKLAVYKDGWKDAKRETSSTNPQSTVRFRTHGEARIRVSASGPPKPYRLLVMVGAEVKPEVKAAFVPMADYRKRPSGIVVRHALPVPVGRDRASRRGRRRHHNPLVRGQSP